ncbi:MAG: hypothetical protein RJAPGHWK_001651, partial [Candidatus Fervidibacter sp.]
GRVAAEQVGAEQAVEAQAAAEQVAEERGAEGLVAEERGAAALAEGVAQEADNWEAAGLVEEAPNNARLLSWSMVPSHLPSVL